MCYVLSMANKQPKVLINFRTAQSGRDMLDEIAEQHRVDRSDVIRAALALALDRPKELAATIEARR